MNFRAYIYSILSIFLLIGISNASNLENRVTSYFNSLANSLSTSVSSLLGENDRVKYLDLNLGVQDDLKPTISLTNVNMISQYSNSTIFNQNSLNFHDNDQIINLGIGHRTLLNNDKVIFGVNLFFDYAFDDSHQRNGAGMEVISSVFDLRSNIYDATSGIETVSIGKDEEAMDGWDMRLDYHLPIKANARLFAGLFEFENAAGSFEIEGEKYGLNIIGNNLDFEVGYIDDNKTGDGSFANLSYVIPLGNSGAFSNDTSNYFEYVSVAERLYEPVKRENKIRVTKTSLNVTASGF
jgi:adhesin/invasin